MAHPFRAKAAAAAASVFSRWGEPAVFTRPGEEPIAAQAIDQAGDVVVSFAAARLRQDARTIALLHESVPDRPQAFDVITLETPAGELTFTVTEAAASDDPLALVWVCAVREGLFLAPDNFVSVTAGLAAAGAIGAPQLALSVVSGVSGAGLVATPGVIVSLDATVAGEAEAGAPQRTAILAAPLVGVGEIGGFAGGVNLGVSVSGEGRIAIPSLAASVTAPVAGEGVVGAPAGAVSLAAPVAGEGRIGWPAVSLAVPATVSGAGAIGAPQGVLTVSAGASGIGAVGAPTRLLALSAPLIGEGAAGAPVRTISLAAPAEGVGDAGAPSLAFAVDAGVTGEGVIGLPGRSVAVAGALTGEGAVGAPSRSVSVAALVAGAGLVDGQPLRAIALSVLVTGEGAIGEPDVEAAASSPPVFRSAATSGSTTCAKPSGTVEGDLLLAFIPGAPQGQSITPPSGWTLIDRAQQAGDDIFGVAYWKKAGASEPSNYTWSAPGAGFFAAAILRYDGQHASAPIGPSTDNSGSGTTRTALGVTTPEANCLLVAMLGGVADTSTTPSGMTERAEIISSVQVYDQTIASAGATGNRTNTGGSGGWVTIAVAIRPAA